MEDFQGMESKTPLKAVDSKMSPTEHISRPNATQSSAYKLKKRYLELYTENSEDSGVLLSLERHAYENDNSKPGKNQKIDSVQRTNNPTSLGTQAVQKSKPISNFFRLYMLKLDLANLSDPGVCPTGIYIMPSLGFQDIWYGVLFVHQDMWKGGVFKFRIEFPEEYPYKAPELYFMTKVYHPLIRDFDGKFQLEIRFQNWTAFQDQIFLVLGFLKSSFKTSFLKSLAGLTDTYNTNALNLFCDNSAAFRDIALGSVERSVAPKNLYKSEAPDCPLVFSTIPDNQYENIKRQMFSTIKEDIKSGRR